MNGVRDVKTKAGKRPGVCPDGFSIYENIGNLARRVKLDQHAPVVQVVRQLEFCSIPACAAPVIIPAILAVKVVPGVRQRDVFPC